MMSQKKIAAPRPLKRSTGVAAPTRNKFARSEFCFHADEDGNTASEFPFDDPYGERSNEGEEGIVQGHVLAASYRIASALDDETTEMEGSCEIQRIFLSGFHTPGPRGIADEEDEDNSRLYFVSDQRLTAQPQSPSSFQFFIPSLPGARNLQHDEDEDENGGLGMSRDFPLLGNSPNYHHQGRFDSNDEDDNSDYFEAYLPIYPRASNPVPLNTPFHASVDAPAVLYESQHRLVLGTRGHFCTLPSSGVRPLKATAGGAQLFAAAPTWGAEEIIDVGAAAETHQRTTRNRSYSEPIPFVPVAAFTRTA